MSDTYSSILIQNIQLYFYETQPASPLMAEIVTLFTENEENQLMHAWRGRKNPTHTSRKPFPNRSRSRCRISELMAKNLAGPLGARNKTELTGINHSRSRAVFRVGVERGVNHFSVLLTKHVIDRLRNAIYAKCRNNVHRGFVSVVLEQSDYIFV